MANKKDEEAVNEEEDDDDDEEDDQGNKVKWYEIPDEDTSDLVVLVGNLPEDTETEDVLDHFREIDDIEEVRLFQDPRKRTPRMMAYIEMRSEESCHTALAFHNSFMGDHKIKVYYAHGDKKLAKEIRKEIEEKEYQELVGNQD